MKAYFKIVRQPSRSLDHVYYTVYRRKLWWWTYLGSGLREEITSYVTGAITPVEYLDARGRPITPSD